ncbi:MAG: VWA domain-containing protein [Verrucomicrobiota bacterium]
MILLYPLVLLVLIGYFAWKAFDKRIVHTDALSVPAISAWQKLSKGRANYLWVLKVLWWTTLVFLVFALSRPQALFTQSKKNTKGIAIKILVDISSSMDMAIDLPNGTRESRMEVAKEMVERFIMGDGQNLSGRQQDLIGLITFARYADTRSPLTLGHQALVDIVQRLEVQNRPNEDGTAYGDALTLACARLEKLSELQVEQGDGSKSAPDIESRVVVLLTDGENNSGKYLPQEASAFAQKWNCRVYVISLGDQLLTDENGKKIPPSAADQVLEHIASSTGGVFRKASDYESLLSVYEEIDELERTKIRIQEYIAPSDLFWIPLSLGVISLLSMLLLESTWLRVAP